MPDLPPPRRDPTQRHTVFRRRTAGCTPKSSWATRASRASPRSCTTCALPRPCARSGHCVPPRSSPRPRTRCATAISARTGWSRRLRGRGPPAAALQRRRHAVAGRAAGRRAPALPQRRRGRDRVRDRGQRAARLDVRHDGREAGRLRRHSARHPAPVDAGRAGALLRDRERVRRAHAEALPQRVRPAHRDARRTPSATSAGRESLLPRDETGDVSVLVKNAAASPSWCSTTIPSTWSAGTASTIRGRSASTTSSRASAACTCRRRCTRRSRPTAFVVCSFCPRPFDFDPEAVPAPYSHSNAMSDEVLYYANAEFMSRKGIEFGSLTLHPDGLRTDRSRADRSVARREMDERAGGDARHLPPAARHPAGARGRGRAVHAVVVEGVSVAAGAPAGALGALLEGVVDYAGLFPPGGARPPDGGRRVRRAWRGPDAWMLGRFILPASWLGEWRRRPGPRERLVAQRAVGPGEAPQVDAFNAAHAGARLDVVELKVTTPDEVAAALTRAPSARPRTWRFRSTRRCRRSSTRSRSRRRAKARTGGVTAALPRTGGGRRSSTAACRGGRRSRRRLADPPPRRAGARRTRRTRARCLHGLRNLLSATALLAEGAPSSGRSGRCQEGRRVRQDGDALACAATGSTGRPCARSRGLRVLLVRGARGGPGVGRLR